MAAVRAGERTTRAPGRRWLALQLQMHEGRGTRDASCPPTPPVRGDSAGAVAGGGPKPGGWLCAELVRTKWGLVEEDDSTDPNK